MHMWSAVNMKIIMVGSCNICWNWRVLSYSPCIVNKILAFDVDLLWNLIHVAGAVFGEIGGCCVAGTVFVKLEAE